MKKAADNNVRQVTAPHFLCSPHFVLLTLKTLKVLLCSCRLSTGCWRSLPRNEPCQTAFISGFCLFSSLANVFQVLKYRHLVSHFNTITVYFTSLFDLFLNFYTKLLLMNVILYLFISSFYFIDCKVTYYCWTVSYFFSFSSFCLLLCCTLTAPMSSSRSKLSALAVFFCWLSLFILLPLLNLFLNLVLPFHLIWKWSKWFVGF